MVVPDPNDVKITYISPTTKRIVRIVCDIETARQHWEKLPISCRDTYTIRSAELEDFD